MVILEIERSYPDFGGLLGEHKWNEFLKNPTDEEKDRLSQIFYCIYTSGRDAQKDGKHLFFVLNFVFIQFPQAGRGLMCKMHGLKIGAP